MKWFFTPPAESDPPPDHDDHQPSGLIGLPAALLQRHGALVLDPGKTAVVGDDQPPQPTVYGARTLLVPGHVLQDEYLLRAIRTVLADIKLELITPEPDRQTDRGDEFDLPEPPRTAVLVPAAGHSVPVVIDAWVALQTCARRPSRSRIRNGTPKPSGRSRWSICWSARPSAAARPPKGAAA